MMTHKIQDILSLREWANKRVKEHAEELRKQRTKNKRQVFGRFQSKSSPTVVYTVEKLGNSMICNCPGFIFRKSCKHTKEVLESC